jgi:hypothetical protein
MTFDYAIVTPTTSTSLSGATLIADDTDAVIRFNTDGRWQRESGTRFASGRAYNDTRVGTDRQGDRFTINFNGRSLVYLPFTGS